MPFYEEIKIWEHLDTKTAICYVCFRSLQSNLFYVQSADYYSDQSDEKYFHKQMVELFTEETPEDRTNGFKSIQEAIFQFKNQFRE